MTVTKNIFPIGEKTPRKIPLNIFAEDLSKERGFNLLRTYYYLCAPYQGVYPTIDEKKRVANHNKFRYSLNKLRQFKVKEGRLQKVFTEQGKPDFIQKGVDVQLAIDMLKLALKGAIQTAILIACDADFIPVVRVMQDEGVVVHLYYHHREKDFSQQLVDECDDRHKLTEEHFKKYDKFTG